MKLDKNVAKWAVNVLEISRTRRHLDRATLMVFWEKLDKYELTIKYCYIFVFNLMVGFAVGYVFFTLPCFQHISSF
jgi:hypothetical protein